MSLNSLGLGFIFSAKDLASGTMKDLEVRLNKLEGVSADTAARMEKGFKSAAAGLAVLTVGLKGLEVLGGTVTDARDFGKAIGEVSTLVDEASFPISKMRSLTKDLAGDFGLDALQQAPALYQAISAGATDVESATKLMVASNKFAIGGVTDLTVGVDVLSTAVNAFKSQNLSAADAADTMFVAIRAGKTTARELGSTLGRVLPIANSLGISFAEVNAAIAATTASGLNTARSVTGLNAALANVIKPTKDAKDEAKRLGIQFTAGAVRAKGFRKFIDSITGSSKFTKDSISKLFASVEGLNFVTSLTTNNGKKFKQVLGEMGNRAGATDAAFGKMNGTLDQQIKRYEALKKNVRITIGEALAPLVRVLVNGMALIFKGFQALPAPVQKMIAIFGVLLAVTTTLAGAFLLMRGAVLLLGPAFSAATAKMIPMLLPFAKFILIAAALGAAFLLLKTLFDKNIGGFGDDMREVWADMRPALEALGNAVKDVGRVLLDALRPVLPIFKFLAKVAIKIVIIAIKLLAFQIKIFAKFLAVSVKVLALMFQGLAIILGFVGRLVRDFFIALIGLVIDVANIVSDKLSPTFESVGRVMSTVGSAVIFVWDTVKAAIMPIIDAITAAVKRLFSFIGKVVGAVKTLAGAAKSAFGTIDIKDLPRRELARRQAVKDADAGGVVSRVAPQLIGPATMAIGSPGAAMSSQAAGAQSSQAGQQATAGPTQLNANFTIEIDGEVIASKVKSIETDNRQRRSQ